jgi:glycine oxidase
VTGASDVVVVGAGVIGAAVAWRAAQRGVPVTLVDPQPGCGASWAAAGMLAPVAEAAYGEESLLALCLDSARRYPGLLAELAGASPVPVRHPTAGTLVVAFDGDDLRALETLAGYHEELGLPVRRVTAREARRLEPLLSPRLRGGLALDGDHAVDPRALLAALLDAGGRAGTRLLRQRVERVVLDGGRAAGVRLDTGEVMTASTVVVAAGCWSGPAGPLADLPSHLVPPVRPVKGQVLRLRGETGPLALTRTVRGWVHGSPVYAVPYGDGRVVVGATSEERGFDTTVTAGAAYALLRDALALLPALGELELVEATARLRPGTPDNAPLLGPTDVPGLVLATGHYRNGVLLTPATADALGGYLAGDGLPPEVAAFSPRRFAPQEVPA